jgi:hypothetical protein
MRLQPASKGFELSGRLRVRETGPKKNFSKKIFSVRRRRARVFADLTRIWAELPKHRAQIFGRL